MYGFTVVNRAMCMFAGCLCKDNSCGGNNCPLEWPSSNPVSKTSVYAYIKNYRASVIKKFTVKVPGQHMGAGSCQ